MSVRNIRVSEKRDGTSYKILLDSRLKSETLLFDTGAIAELQPSEVEELKKLGAYTKVVDAYGCLGVLQVDTTNQYLVLVTSCVSVGKIQESDIYRITGTSFISLQGTEDDKPSGVQKLFNSGTYYFALSSNGMQYDLTLCTQRRLQDQQTDNRFFWNRAMHIQFERYGIECKDWLLRCICGGIEIRTIYSGHKQAKACLISRLSCERAGTRFNTRGTNDEGHVANFVETEQVIVIDDVISSHVQIRGSVPLFWEQPGLNVGSHKVKFSRGYEACAPALERHINGLQKHYGQISLVNLLGNKEGEHSLSDMFKNHLQASQVCRQVPYQHFDYHSECRGNTTKNLEKLLAKVKGDLDEFGIFHFDGTTITQQQRGCFRTNCVDCLDRTNAVQTFFGIHVLAKQLDALGLLDKAQMVGRFQEIYRQIWPVNGDHISRIYAGTSAMTVGKSKYRDVTTSATRAIQNNFLDSSKQDAINMLLLGGRRRNVCDEVAHTLSLTNSMHASPGLIERLLTRHAEYTVPQNTRVCLATWNVNGGTHFRSIAFRHESLNDWLLDMYANSLTNSAETCDASGDPDVDTDIFAVGFEEIVDLTAKNITSASTSNQKTWGAELEKTLSRAHKYILVTSVQLVGVCLFVFVRPHLAPLIRDVAVDRVKTGLGGAAGNKGAVAIRFILHNSSLCFVCAHFAAGQSGIKERNNDFAEICSKISFPLGGTIKSHEYVFWVGDFNYRIELPKSEAEMLIKDGNWSALQDVDQLKKQRAEGNVFQGYEEGIPNFAPTYKYDLFCDDYDTSEKARVPSWTDRCLWKRHKVKGYDKSRWSAGKLLVYNRAELKTSDHRPVAALIDISVLKVDRNLKESVQEAVVLEEGPTDGTVVVASADNSILSDINVNTLVDLCAEVGDVILVRFVEHEVLLTFSNGRQAIAAMERFDNYQMVGQVITARLNMPVWKDNVRNELKMDTSVESTFYSAVTNDLLGEDFKHRSLSFDVGDDDDEDDDLGNFAENGASLHINSLKLDVSPAVTPTVSGRNTPVNLLESTAEKKTAPPARPCKPPSRPPPPKKSWSVEDLLTGSPPPAQTAPSSFGAEGCQADLLSSNTDPFNTKPMVIGHPELVAHSAAPTLPVVMRAKTTSTNTCNKRTPSMIGMPTNVIHAGAKTEDDARKLIGSLMAGQSMDLADLPAPLLPASGNKEENRSSDENISDINRPDVARAPPSRPSAMPKSFSTPSMQTTLENHESVTVKSNLVGSLSTETEISGLVMGSKGRGNPPPPIPTRTKLGIPASGDVTQTNLPSQGLTNNHSSAINGTNPFSTAASGNNPSTTAASSSNPFTSAASDSNPSTSAVSSSNSFVASSSSTTIESNAGEFNGAKGRTPPPIPSRPSDRLPVQPGASTLATHSAAKALPDVTAQPDDITPTTIPIAAPRVMPNEIVASANSRPVPPAIPARSNVVTTNSSSGRPPPPTVPQRRI